MNKILVASLACMMAVSPVLAAEAEIPAITVPKVGDQAAQKGENNVPVTLDVLKQNKPIITFSVTVPTSLPLVMDLSGNVKTATNAQVKNNSTEDVVVTDVNLTSADGWTLAVYDSALKERPADTKELGMEINTCKTNTENLLFEQEKFPTVKAKDKMPVTYNALLPRQKTAGSVGTVANSVFVIGWADPTIDEPLKPHAKGTVMSRDKFRSATQSLTGTVAISTKKYNADTMPGTVTDVSEAGDGSVMCVVNGQDATVYGEGGVKCPNGSGHGLDYEGSDDDTGLFWFHQAQTLDVSGLDTSGVTHMGSMFERTEATKIIGFENFDTSSVIDMGEMFEDACAKELDLSSFDTRNLQTAQCMFYSADATTLNVSSFTGENLKSTEYMFYYVPATTLNLSNLDISQVNNVNDMFYGSGATTVYCRTQEDMQKMQSSSNCNATGFQVGKPSA